MPCCPWAAFSEESVTVATRAKFDPVLDCGLTVSVAEDVLLPTEAEIVTDATAETELVLTVKVLEVEPAAMVTLAGTLATEGLLLDRLTTTPLLGAGAVSVTVPCEGLPPNTAVGFRASDGTIGFTVSVAV